MARFQRKVQSRDGGPKGRERKLQSTLTCRKTKQGEGEMNQRRADISHQRNPKHRGEFRSQAILRPGR